MCKPHKMNGFSRTEREKFSVRKRMQKGTDG